MSEGLQHAEPVVDAHHHLWRYNAAEFDWIDDRMAVLRRDFTQEDLRGAMRNAGVDYTVAVQARQSLEETRHLLAVAQRTPAVAAVVGWLPLTDAAGLDAALEELSAMPWLVGARHVVQGEPAGFLEAASFNQGICSLTQAGLAYDLLVRADQLEEALRFVDWHPDTRFALDHMAKPLIATSALEPWATQVRELARRPNVFCKLSGIVTEALWDQWSLTMLRPYLDTVVDAFGSGRLMAGSDWPVCLVACTYEQWWTTLRAYFATFSADERSGCFGGNAMRFYQLDLSSSPDMF